MSTLVLFIVSLTLIVFLLIIKSLEIFYGRKIFLESLFLKCDKYIYHTGLKIKFWWSYATLRNTKLIFLRIIVSIRKLIVGIKRRFDHKQSHFFTRKEHDVLKNKSSVSFFLKNVSDYKKDLREEKGDREIKD
jgi:hypothetical protein